MKNYGKKVQSFDVYILCAEQKLALFLKISLLFKKMTKKIFVLCKKYTILYRNVFFVHIAANDCSSTLTV
jgi:hypothetical protein